ncbi:hypothetical protein KOY_05223 [Bacillus cereus VDM021]|nr:hypothetical protein KOY_05223 [Bacillus cereus VDM021]
MARQRSPDRDKAFEIYKASKGEKPLIDIAAELNLKPSQIRKWKSQDKWDEQFNGNVTIAKRSVTKVLLQSWKKYREVYRLEIGFKQSLLIAVVLCTLKRRSLIQDFVFVYIWPESFQSLL